MHCAQWHYLTFAVNFCFISVYLSLPFQKWREFCNVYKDSVDDFNFGSLLRIDCNLDVSDANTTMGSFVLLEWQDITCEFFELI